MTFNESCNYYRGTYRFHNVICYLRQISDYTTLKSPNNILNIRYRLINY